MSERRRVAVHEAGHAAASVLLGLRGQGPVSVVPSAAAAGICFTGSPRRPTAADLDGVGRPGPLQPARVRRYFECSVMVLMAGQIAEDRLFWDAGGAEALLESCAPGPAVAAAALPRRDAAVLADHAGRTAGRNDRERIREDMDLLAAWTGRRASRLAHEALLRTWTRELLADDRATRMVLALTEALMTHDSLSGRQWVALLRAVP